MQATDGPGGLMIQGVHVPGAGVGDSGALGWKRPVRIKGKKEKRSEERR